MKYRADIDGLRCLAVLPVVFFHAGLGGFSGGFVGVDIFFVISGFLITRIILEARAAQRFSFLDFYARRIRRILPALVPVIGFALVFSVLFLPLSERRDFFDSLIGAATFTSNYVFLEQAGYFNGPVELKPLLHTWSLAIEEQFYVVFPLVCVLAMTFAGRRALGILLSVILIASLAANVYVLRDVSANLAFYSTPLRIWELLAGCLLAVWPVKLGRGAAQALGLIGLALIIAAVVLFTPCTPFPGVAALLPVAGAVMVIVGGAQSETIAARILSYRPFVQIGKISYGLYLWHWPLLVAVWFVFPGSQLMVGAAILVSFVLAGLSYLFWEKPLRFGKWLGAPVRAFAFLAVLVIGGIGLSSVFLYRYAPLDTRFADLDPADNMNWKRVFDRDAQGLAWAELDCQNRIPGAETIVTACLDTRGGRRTVMLVGDSHAEHLVPGLEARWPEEDFIRIVGGGCYPLIGFENTTEPCRKIADYLFNAFERWEEVDRVYLSVRYYDAHRTMVLETLAWFQSKGVDVTLVGQTPVFEPALDVLAQSHSNLSAFHQAARAAAITDDKDIAADLKQSLPEGVSYIDSFDIICGEALSCQTSTEEGWPLFLDEDHFSVPGAIWFVRQW